MYFNINNKTVKVSINNGKQVPSFLEQDLDTIAKHFNVSSINRISIVSNDDDYMGLTQGNIIKDKKCVDMFLSGV